MLSACAPEIFGGLRATSKFGCNVVEIKLVLVSVSLLFFALRSGDFLSRVKGAFHGYDIRR